MLSQRNINAVNDFDTFETTEDRLTFLIHIPIHAGCGNKPATEKTTVITTEKSAIGSEKNGSGSEKSSEKSQAIISAIRLNPKVTAAEIAMKLGVSSRAVEKRIKTLRENGVIRRIGGDKGGYWEVIENGTEQQQHTESGVKGGVKGGVKELSEIQEIIVKEMLFDPSITTSEMAQKTGIKFRTLQRHISQLQAMGIVVRKDGRKDGYWEVAKSKQSSDTMPAIVTDSFDYNDIVRVLDLDEAFVHHQIDALQPKYWRIVIKTKPKGLKIFAPVMVSGNRGIDYMIYMLSRDWQITKKQRLLDYMYFGVYRQTDGFHLVGFMYLDSNPLAKPEKAFFTPHFFDRYKERTGLPMDTPKMEVMKDWIMKNLHLNSDAQGNEKYPDGIFCAYPSGVALGRELSDGNSEMKTFITYDMLRGEQIEKGENQSKAAKVQEEEGFRNCKELVDKLVKYGIHL